MVFFQIGSYFNSSKILTLNFFHPHQSFQQLARHGIPDTLVSDNGPPFNGQEFAEFSRAYEFNHVTSSPNCAQSNGKAENAVKVIKRLINKSVADQKDPYLALLDLRNTPSQDIGYSAVQRIFGRRTKTLLPVSEDMLKPRYADKVKEQVNHRKGRETHYYNKGAKELPTFQEGEGVRVRPKGNEKSLKKAIVEPSLTHQADPAVVVTRSGRVVKPPKHLQE